MGFQMRHDGVDCTHAPRLRAKSINPYGGVVDTKTGKDVPVAGWGGTYYGTFEVSERVPSQYRGRYFVFGNGGHVFIGPKHDVSMPSPAERAEILVTKMKAHTEKLRVLSMEEKDPQQAAYLYGMYSAHLAATGAIDDLLRAGRWHLVESCGEPRVEVAEERERHQAYRRRDYEKRKAREERRKVG